MDEVLSRFEAQLGSLFAGWQRVLRTNLASESAQRNLEMATGAERWSVEQFVRQDETDPTLPDGFLEAADQVMRDLHTVSMSFAEMMAAVRDEGRPCTAEELQRRLTGLVDRAMLDRDPRTTRLALDP